MAEARTDITLSRKDAVLRICEMQSHELVSGLAGARELVTTILDDLVGDLAAPQRDLLQTATRCIDDCRDALETLVTVTQFESQRICVDLQEVDAVELVRSAVASGQRLCRDRSIDLAYDYEVDLPAARADRELLLEILNKLVQNAVQLSPDGAMVSVRVTQAPTHDGYLRVAVVTNAIHDPGVLDGAFDLFQCAMRNDSASGPMLALVACKELVELQGGDIWAETSATDGTTFVFNIPAAPVCEAVRGPSE